MYGKRNPDKPIDKNMYQRPVTLITQDGWRMEFPNLKELVSFTGITENVMKKVVNNGLLLDETWARATVEYSDGGRP